MPNSTPMTPVRHSLGGGGAACIVSSAQSRSREQLLDDEPGASPLALSPGERMGERHKVSPERGLLPSERGLRTWRHCSCQTALVEVKAMLAEVSSQCEAFKGQAKVSRRQARERPRARGLLAVVISSRQGPRTGYSSNTGGGAPHAIASCSSPAIGRFIDTS